MTKGQTICDERSEVGACRSLYYSRHRKHDGETTASHVLAWIQSDSLLDTRIAPTSNETKTGLKLLFHVEIFTEQERLSE